MREESHKVVTDLENRAVHASDIRQDVHHRVYFSGIYIVEGVLSDIYRGYGAVLRIHLVIIKMTIFNFYEVNRLLLPQLQKVILKFKL
jgi:hypothetical protein